MSKTPKRKTARPRKQPVMLIDESRERAYCWFYDHGGTRRRKITLGPAGSPESHRAFARVQEQWQAVVSGEAPPPPAEPEQTSIGDLCAQFLRRW